VGARTSRQWGEINTHLSLTGQSLRRLLFLSKILLNFWSAAVSYSPARR